MNTIYWLFIVYYKHSVYMQCVYISKCIDSPVNLLIYLKLIATEFISVAINS